MAVVPLPSARSVFSILTSLLPGWLTPRRSGSTISMVEAEITRTNAVFFKGRALLTTILLRAALALVWSLERSVCGTDAEMTTLAQLQQNRRVIQDFTLTTLADIPGLFARLVYVASLRDLSSGKYEHAGLAALYPEEALQQALEVCHEQVFEKVLEASLEAQEEDLRGCLSRMSEGFCATVTHWQRMESYRVLLPEQSPDYLKELFCSNLRALLEILQIQCSPAYSDA
jgi:hypothetical protein